MTLWKRAFCQLGAVLALASMAAACTPSKAQTPTPAPASTSSSPAETQLERQQRLDFEAAAKAYRSFLAEYDRVAAAGGSDHATPAMKEYAAGPYLEVMTDFLSQAKAAKKRQVGHLRVGYLRYGAYSSKQLTLEVCEDGSKVRNVNKAGHVSYGLIGQLSLYVRPVEGKWKIWNGDEKTVKSCESA